MYARLRNLTLFLTTLAALAPAQVAGQLISVKTVPVATGDQFLTRPSARLGMAGVRIALDDALLDPFLNPAKGSLIEESVLLGTPTFYGISNRNGAGRTLPLSALFRSDKTFGGVSFALQQLKGGDRNGFFAPVEPWFGGGFQSLGELSATNVYADGVFGVELGDTGFSLGAGISWAGLEALDGVEHLYSRASGIDQSGRAMDYRVGLFSNREGRHFEVVLVHNRFSMTHDVTYTDWTWDDCAWDDCVRPTPTTRMETNEDKTRTTGLQLGFARPLTESGWRVGGTWTVNRKSHPKIPNYDIMNIPRDPGISWAYNFGVGIAKSSGPATFGIDLVFEPIWSKTWVEAESDTTSVGGAVIEEGDRTIENEFFFTNVQMRMGLAHEMERMTFQLGVEVRSYDYTLEQRDNIEDTIRDQDESWMEWTPSLGATVKFAEFQLGYVGRMTTGSGRPGVQNFAVLEATRDADIILAPSGPLILADARVLTHQVTVSIPIR